MRHTVSDQRVLPQVKMAVACEYVEKELKALLMKRMRPAPRGAGLMAYVCAAVDRSEGDERPALGADLRTFEHGIHASPVEKR
jgi:hypothetical protein